jgi:hypothetical protein
MLHSGGSLRREAVWARNYKGTHMNKLAWVSVAVAGAFALSACDAIPFLPKSKQGMLTAGEWECAGRNLPDGLSNIVMHFKRGGDLEVGMKGSSEQGGQTMRIDVTLTGDWSLDGETLTVEPKHANIREFTVGGQDMAAMMGGSEAMERQMVSNSDNGEMTIKRISNDRLVLEDDDENEIRCER